MRHIELKHREAFDIRDAAEIWPRADALAAAPLAEIEAGMDRPTAAVPDMPAAIGRMIVAVYAGIIGIFLLTMAGSGEALFMIVISGLYVAMFFAVPRLMLKVEGDPSRRPTLARFLDRGIVTGTGHMTGGSAMAQIFVVPICLGIALLAMGITALIYL